MQYKKIYNDLISSRKKLNRSKKDNIYYENHHILPVSFGGTNDKFNLVLLTGKEHWIAHLLLCKFSKGQNKYSANQAVLNMGRIISSSKRKTSNLYEASRKIISKHVSKRHTGTLVVKDLKTGIRIGRIDKKHPKVISGEWIFFHNGMTRSEDFKNKVSNSVSGKKNGTYCGVSNEMILDVCCEIFEKYNSWSWGFTIRYFSTIYNLKLPTSKAGPFRKPILNTNIEKMLIEKYKIKNMDLLNPHKMRYTKI